MPLISFTEVNIQKIKIMASSPITSWKIKGEKVEVVTNFIFLGSRITVDSDCSHEIKRCLLIGRKTMRNLDSKFKSLDITLPIQVPIVKARIFPDIMCGCEISSVIQLCPTLCNPMDCCMPGFPVHHQLLELAQTHVHWLSDAIQPSHALSSPSPPAFNLSQHQGFFPVSQLFTLGGQSIRISASQSVLPMNIQDWFPLGWTSWISLQSKGLSRVFSNTTVQNH